MTLRRKYSARRSLVVMIGFFAAIAILSLLPELDPRLQFVHNFIMETYAHPGLRREHFRETRKRRRHVSWFLKVSV